MSEFRTDHSRHKSITTQIFCSDAQYLAEFMCVRIADKRREYLQPNFWNELCWKATYQQQVLAANNLLKAYSFEAIINTVKQRQYHWVTSLRTKQILPQIAIEQGIIDKEKAKLAKIAQTNTVDVTENVERLIVKPFSSNKNKLSNLD